MLEMNKVKLRCVWGHYLKLKSWQKIWRFVSLQHTWCVHIILPLKWRADVYKSQAFSFSQDRWYWRQKMEETPGSLAPSLPQRTKIWTTVFFLRINYRFNSVSFRGKEPLIIGKPAILLHTSDALRELGENNVERPTSWEYGSNKTACLHCSSML
jgi:hypothetical protein